MHANSFPEKEEEEEEEEEEEREKVIAESFSTEPARLSSSDF